MEGATVQENKHLGLLQRLIYLTHYKDFSYQGGQWLESDDDTEHLGPVSSCYRHFYFLPFLILFSLS